MQPNTVTPDFQNDAVVLVDDGKIVATTPTAREGYGIRDGDHLDETLRSLLGSRAGPALKAFGHLQQFGTEVRVTANDRLDRAIEFLGAPQGGQIKVVLRDAAPEPQEDMVKPTLPEMGPEAWAETTLATLLDNTPLVVWNRTATGEVNWFGGEIAVQGKVVDANQAIAMIVARQSFNERSCEPIRRTRLEIGDGEPLALHVVEILGKDGNICGFAVDASLAATVERTLTRFIQTMTETFAHLTVGLGIFDRNHRLVLFNPTLADMWEIDAVWLARRPDLSEILDRLRSSGRLPHLANYHEWRDRLLALFENPDAVQYEESWDLASGERIRVMARPHPHGALAFVFDDVTEQMQLETRYRHMDDLLSTALERLDEGLVVFGPDGLLRFVNSSFHEIWETDTEAVSPGMHARDVFGLCSRLSVETDLWSRGVTFATGEVHRKVWTRKLTLATGQLVRARFAPLPGGSTLAVFTDMSDSERAAQALIERSEALEAAEEMRRAVLDQISHQLRTPLNSIFGFGQLLSDPRFGELNLRQQAYASGIIEAAEHLLDTVQDVTELASLRACDGRSPSDMIEMDTAIEATYEVLSPRAVNAGVDLRMVEGAPVGTLYRNALPLRQILFYLTADAIQRSEKDAVVEIGASRTDAGHLVLSVTETPAEGKTRTASQIESASPIVPLVKRLVEREGGTLRIENCADLNGVKIACEFKANNPLPMPQAEAVG
ncbi:PAS-domain containing protein [Rhodobacteraceae bacterium NNCM2]|nr:PAS-domain containing protein [Coraliihabitans acroporae]